VIVAPIRYCARFNAPAVAVDGLDAPAKNIARIF
jgi:hypothetical protein